MKEDSVPFNAAIFVFLSYSLWKIHRQDWYRFSLLSMFFLRSIWTLRVAFHIDRSWIPDMVRTDWPDIEPPCKWFVQTVPSFCIKKSPNGINPVKASIHDYIKFPKDTLPPGISSLTRWSDCVSAKNRRNNAITNSFLHSIFKCKNSSVIRTF